MISKETTRLPPTATVPTGRPRLPGLPQRLGLRTSQGSAQDQWTPGKKGWGLGGLVWVGFGFGFGGVGLVSVLLGLVVVFVCDWLLVVCHLWFNCPCSVQLCSGSHSSAVLSSRMRKKRGKRKPMPLPSASLNRATSDFEVSHLG